MLKSQLPLGAVKEKQPNTSEGGTILFSTTAVGGDLSLTSLT